MDLATQSGTPSLGTFTGAITATKDKKQYTFTMVGANPFLGGGASTTTGVPVFPIILHFNSDGSVFEPPPLSFRFSF